MKQLPLTVRRSIELVGLFVLGYIFVIGKGILMPVLMAFFLAIVLLPLYRIFIRWKIPEAFAIVLPILMLAIMMALIVWFFSSQIGVLVQDFPQIQKNVSAHLTSLSDWINRKTDFSTQEQVDFLRDQSNRLVTNAGNLISGAAVSLSSVFVFLGLLPIYIYLFLFYKNLLLRFIFIWFDPASHAKVEEVMKETEIIIKSYLIGLLIQVSYMTVLLGGILMLVGIKHALLIGVIFALLNLIPYIGALFGNLIGVLLTLTSSDELWPVFTVLGIIALVQFIDNNILMPRIVGSKVRINAFAAILGVFAGGKLAGISGMFLALPIIAVLKIVFDRSVMFRQWGVLLGDEKPTRSPIQFPKLRRKSEKVTEKIQEENKIKPVKAKGKSS